MKLKLGLLFTIIALTAPVLAAPAAQASYRTFCPGDNSQAPGHNPNGPGARWWATSKQLGAQNNCRQWLVITWGPKGNAGSKWSDLYVPPNSKFLEKSLLIPGNNRRGGFFVDSPNLCSSEYANYVVSNGQVTQKTDCFQ